MSVASFLKDLRVRGVELELADGRLVCRAPKGAMTPEMTAVLRERKAEILDFLREGLAERGTHPIPPIRPAERRELMPVSFSQERLWYLNQVDANPAVYNLPLSFRLVGSLQVDVLQRCLDAIEARHEALRTTVVALDGQAMQRIHEPRGMPLAQVDLRPGHRAVDAPPCDAVLQREAMAPFDLSTGPLARATLIRTADDEYYFLIVSHHIISDGLSTQIVLRELVALYEAFSGGKPSPLEPLPIQFADYAVWQRSWLQGPALEEQLAYWMDRLGDRLPTLEIATDFPRPPIRSANGSKEPLRLPRELVRRLGAIAREEGATTYMVLLALYQTLLYRYSGQDDVIVGTPVANRTRTESAGIVGFVANTLVLRTRFEGARSFRDVIQRVRDACVGASRRQDMPFQKLVEVLNPPRDLSRTPIFQAFFTFHEISSQATRMGNLELQPVVVGSNVSRMDLSLFLRELDAEILGSLEYNTDIFSRDTILRMIGHLGTLAESAAANPDAPVNELSLLTGAEYAALATWNDTEMRRPELLVHELVAGQALATPGRVALRSGAVALTYGQLEDRSNRLARVLQAKGVQADELVGLCVDRSVDLVVAVLGVLKAGAAYVPLDPDFPASRLEYMLDDARVRIVVTQQSLAGQLPAAGRTLVCLEESELAQASDAPPRCEATPDSRAYVIYTSGSTGRPKGVEVRHRNVVNFLTTMRERPGIEPEDVLVAVTTLTFDIAVLELFLPLTVGACVVIAPRDIATDGGKLAHLMSAEGATIMQATPATWRLLFDAGWTGQANLRALCGGEALAPELASRLAAVVSELWNMYGPTETTVWSACTQVAGGLAPVPIGSPIGNTILHVVDRLGQTAPVGVPGELFIGGQGVAKGYLGRPELTAARFVPDPTGKQAGAIFYRTGDLVRRLGSGQIEYLGRLDDQVKVQGYRVELGEIESVLGALPEVSEAAVSVHTGDGSDARLVAYVVCRPGRHLTVSEVRHHLRQQLPSYMVPGLILELDALPRTLNGKLDRRALPNPIPEANRRRTHVPPATAAERIVAEAWQALLQVERVSRNDNFFELGGHSLLSMRAVASIEGRTGQRLDPRLMFFQTVEQIAAQLEPRFAAVES